MKYLFAAQFVDGTRIEQTPEDVSRYDPKRSAYYDIVQKLEAGGQLAFFGLTNVEHSFVVDLLDGHFEIDRVVFYAQPVAGPEMPADGTFSLVYQRDHQQDFVQKEGSTSLGDHRVVWRFGWKYAAGDKTFEQTLVVG